MPFSILSPGRRSQRILLPVSYTRPPSPLHWCPVAWDCWKAILIMIGAGRSLHGRLYSRAGCWSFVHELFEHPLPFAFLPQEN